MKKKANPAGKVVVYIVLIILAILSVMPFLIMIVNSTRSTTEIQQHAISLIPSGYAMKNFAILTGKSFNPMRGFLNSLIIATGATLCAVYFSTMTAYGLVVYRWRGRQAFFTAVMAAVALDLTAERRLNLYTANMLANRKSGSVQIRRYDALSGRNAWTVEIGVSKGKKETADVGAKASPVIGQNSLSGLVYFTVTGISAEGSAALGFPSQVASALLALDKETGRIAWAYGMKERTESSPVAVYSPAGEGWLIQCDESGVIHLLEGLTGRVINTLTLDGKIEASPAVYGDMMVISTTGKGDTYIYGIQILGSGRQPAAAAAEAPALPENPAGEAAADVPADPADDPTGPEDPFEGQPGEDAAGIG